MLCDLEYSDPALCEHSRGNQESKRLRDKSDLLTRHILLCCDNADLKPGKSEATEYSSRPSDFCQAIAFQPTSTFLQDIFLSYIHHLYSLRFFNPFIMSVPTLQRDTAFQVRSLFRSLLRQSSQFSSFNFREYARRRTRDAFREHQNETEARKVQEQIQDGLQNLRMMKVGLPFFSPRRIQMALGKPGSVHFQWITDVGIRDKL